MCMRIGLENYVGAQTWGFDCHEEGFGLFPDGHVGSWKSFEQECGRVSVGDGRKVFRPRPGAWGGD